MLALLLSPGFWFPAAVIVAAGAVGLLVRRQRGRDVPWSTTVLAAMNLAYGVVIGIVAVGHTVAVLIKAGLGTLPPTASWLSYVLGFAIGIPAWWLVVHTRRVLRDPLAARRWTVGLNAWLGVTLIALGAAAPLAIPGALNIGYQYLSHRTVGKVIAAVAGLLYVALLVATLAL